MNVPDPNQARAIGVSSVSNKAYCASVSGAVTSIPRLILKREVLNEREVVCVAKEREHAALCPLSSSVCSGPGFDVSLVDSCEVS